MKHWQAIEGSVCPSCGDEAEVLTDTNEQNTAYDSEAARCVSCGHPGSTTVDEDELHINWHDDPAHDCCDWCRAHKPQTTPGAHP